MAAVRDVAKALDGSGDAWYEAGVSWARIGEAHRLGVVSCALYDLGMSGTRRYD